LVQPPCLTTMWTIWPEWTWVSLATASQWSSLLPDHHENRLIWADHCSCGSASIWLSWEPSDLSGLNPDSPPWLARKSPFEFPLRVICMTVSANVDFLLIIDWTFCLVIIFQLLSLLYFWSWKCVPGISIPKLDTSSATSSQQTSYITRLTYFRLSTVHSLHL
jgi:hypothetical protein